MFRSDEKVPFSSPWCTSSTSNGDGHMSLLRVPQAQVEVVTFLGFLAQHECCQSQMINAGIVEGLMTIAEHSTDIDFLQPLFLLSYTLAHSHSLRVVRRGIVPCLNRTMVANRTHEGMDGDPLIARCMPRGKVHRVLWGGCAFLADQTMSNECNKDLLHFSCWFATSSPSSRAQAIPLAHSRSRDHLISVLSVLSQSTVARRAHAGRVGQSFPTLWCGPSSWG